MYLRHLKTLLRKNLMLQRRSLCGSICEILLPILFRGLFCMLKLLVKDDSYP